MCVVARRIYRQTGYGKPPARKRPTRLDMDSVTLAQAKVQSVRQEPCEHPWILACARKTVAPPLLGGIRLVPLLLTAPHF